MKNKELKREIANRKQALQEYGMKIVNNSADAEILVQETLNYAISVCERYNTDVNLDGWLLSIMHNIFLKGCSTN